MGASVERPSELRFLYENDENFTPLPSYFILPGMNAVFTSSIESPYPNVKVSLEKLLHGEQYLEILDEIPRSGYLTSSCKLVDVLDKGSGAVFVYDSKFNIFLQCVDKYT